MNPFNWMLNAQLLTSRYRTPGINGSAGGAGGYSPPSYVPPAYDATDEDTQRRAQNAGRSALLAGLLNSYMNRGQGTGDAFTAMRAASQGVLDSADADARQRMIDARQQRMDQSLEAARQAEIANKAHDNSVADAAAAAKVHADEVKAAADVASRQAELEHRRALVVQVRKVNPTLADQLETQVEAEKFPVGEAIGAHAPRETGQSPGAAAREERAVAAAERAAHSAQMRDIADRAKEIEDSMAADAPTDWTGKVNEKQLRQIRVQARKQAEAEIAGVPMTGSGAGATHTAASTRAPTSAPAAKPAATSLDDVTDPVLKAQIATARAAKKPDGSRYTDDEIVAHLRSQGRL